MFDYKQVNTTSTGLASSRDLIPPALEKTLATVRVARDSYFDKAPSSREGLFFSQLALILTRLEQGIPATIQDVRSLARATAFHPPKPEIFPPNGNRSRHRDRHGKRRRRQGGRQLFHPRREVR